MKAKLAEIAQGTTGKLGLLGASQKKLTSDMCTADARMLPSCGRKVGPAGHEWVMQCCSCNGIRAYAKSCKAHAVTFGE